MLHALSTAWVWLYGVVWAVESLIFVAVMPLIVALMVAEAISDRRKKRRRALAEMLQQPGKEVTAGADAHYVKQLVDEPSAEL